MVSLCQNPLYITSSKGKLLLEYIQIFYTYILPVMALVSFFYIIYLLVRKEAIFRSIEKQIYLTTEKQKDELRDSIIDFYNESKEIFENSLRLIKSETETELEKVKEELSEIQQQTRSLAYDLRNINAENKQLTETILKLREEINKRDAILHRKEKQIQRLKAKK